MHVTLGIFLTSLLASPSYAFHAANLAIARAPAPAAITARSSTSSALFAGPRSEGRRRTSTRGSNGSAGPRPARARRERPAVIVKFDGKALAAEQVPNEVEPTPCDLATMDGLRCMSDDNLDLKSGKDVLQPCFEFLSLDSIHPGLSKAFNEDSLFRNALHDAMRFDIYYSTPAYAKLSEKAASVMLLPDSSLQGSWRKQPTMEGIRMHRLTNVLKDKFGADNAPTGDDLMHAVGALCGSVPSTHWIDIVGVQDRRLNHSWHLDTGMSPENSKTLLWGFPVDDNYTGCGIFSHIVPLQRECHAPEGHPHMQPILFDGATMAESSIVRPEYAPGKELLVYRDIDVIHSSPDVAYRTSVMRFM